MSAREAESPKQSFHNIKLPLKGLTHIEDDALAGDPIALTRYVC